MKYELPCEIVQDLLPSYIDGLTNESTTESVDAHLQTCEVCREMHEDMRASLTEETEMPKEEDARAISFMKKTRSRGRIMVAAGMIVAAVVAFGVMFTRYYMIGEPASVTGMNYQIYRSDDDLEFACWMIDENMGVTVADQTMKDGVLDLTLHSMRKSFFHDNVYQTNFCEVAPEVKRVTLNGSTVIWDEDTAIAPEVAKLYSSHSPYIGDTSAIGKVTKAIGLYEYQDFGGIELQTKEAPYGLTFMAGSVITQEESYDRLEKLPKYGAMLIAAIDNLDHITFTLNVEGDPVEVDVSEADTRRMLGASAKTYIDSPKHLQEMIAALDLAGQPGFNEHADLIAKDNFEIYPNIATDESIFGIGVAIQVNGHEYGSGSVWSADATPLEKGGVGSFFITPETEGYTVDMENDIVELRISIYGAGANMGNCLARLILPLDCDDPAYYNGSTYSREVKITGDSEGGYALE